jgi:aryl-alcohol dehydrogenase-like predicted oxidoreductase
MRYFLLGNSGLRVSEVCLGTMTFGEDWGWGASADVCRSIFDRFLELGGNFIDTANYYTNGSSERMLADMISLNRERIVLATKFSLTMRPGDVNAGGNHRKNIVQAVEASLTRLRTDYIDLYWLHAWDFTTPVEEVMRALDDLVRAGKVFYIGVSDTPAWIVAQANTLAQLRGWTPFTALQVEYSLVERTTERELLPMARALGLGITAWSPLGGGFLTGKYLAQSTTGSGRLKPENRRLNERNHAIASVVVEIAKEMGCSPAQVALAWLKYQRKEVIPIVGARTREQFEDNMGMLNITLSYDVLARLSAVSAIELGFPHEFLSSEGVQNILYGSPTQLIQGLRIP